MLSKGRRIFVLADTHDRLPANVIEMATKADEIWHLGDVCQEIVLDQLRAIGPKVSVVRGNCDGTDACPLVLDLKRDGIAFRLQHIPPERPPPGVDILLHGHTHVPRYERIGEVLILNPGCVTRPNRGAAASVAWLSLAPDQPPDWQLVSIR